jgi:hypothetical protein
VTRRYVTTNRRRRDLKSRNGSGPTVLRLPSLTAQPLAASQSAYAAQVLTRTVIFPAGASIRSRLVSFRSLGVAACAHQQAGRELQNTSAHRVPDRAPTRGFRQDHETQAPRSLLDIHWTPNLNSSLDFDSAAASDARIGSRSARLTETSLPGGNTASFWSSFWVRKTATKSQ